MSKSYEVLKFVNSAKKVEVADRILRLEADNERIGEIQARIKRIEAENAKLREYRRKHDRLQREKLAEVREENVKLHELLQRTWDAFHDATAREFVEVKNELRELGIEVDS